jgi:hypothetical protein
MIINSWRDRLLILDVFYCGNQFTRKNRSKEDDLRAVNEEMQRFHPGPYTVIEYYDSISNLLRFKLKFNDAREETLWLLKNT